LPRTAKCAALPRATRWDAAPRATCLPPAVPCARPLPCLPAAITHPRDATCLICLPLPACCTAAPALLPPACTRTHLPPPFCHVTCLAAPLCGMPGTACLPGLPGVPPPSRCRDCTRGSYLGPLPRTACHRTHTTCSTVHYYGIPLPTHHWRIPSACYRLRHLPRCTSWNCVTTGARGLHCCLPFAAALRAPARDPSPQVPPARLPAFCRCRILGTLTDARTALHLLCACLPCATTSPLPAFTSTSFCHYIPLLHCLPPVHRWTPADSILGLLFCTAENTWEDMVMRRCLPSPARLPPDCAAPFFGCRRCIAHLCRHGPRRSPLDARFARLVSARLPARLQHWNAAAALPATACHNAPARLPATPEHLALPPLPASPACMPSLSAAICRRCLLGCLCHRLPGNLPPPLYVPRLPAVRVYYACLHASCLRGCGLAPRFAPAAVFAPGDTPHCRYNTTACRRAGCRNHCRRLDCLGLAPPPLTCPPPRTATVPVPGIPCHWEDTPLHLLGCAGFSRALPLRCLVLRLSLPLGAACCCRFGRRRLGPHGHRLPLVEDCYLPLRRRHLYSATTLPAACLLRLPPALPCLPAFPLGLWVLLFLAPLQVRFAGLTLPVLSHCRPTWVPPHSPAAMGRRFHWDCCLPALCLQPFSMPCHRTPLLPGFCITRCARVPRMPRAATCVAAEHLLKT